MEHGSFFSGIGGFDIAADWMGWNNVFHCEKEPFPRKILQYYWRNAHSYEDIRETNFTPYRGTIDVLSGGFPCQPYSTSGKRRGKDDPRHLWPEMRRGVREIAPPWIVGENVRGLTNWSGGLVFEEVQADLEAEGYEVQSFLLPAAGVDAPHERYRIWFVAYSHLYGYQRWGSKQDRSKAGASQSQKSEWQRIWHDTYGNGAKEVVADADLLRQPRAVQARNRGAGFGDINRHPQQNATDTNGIGRIQGHEGAKSKFLPAQHIPDWGGFPTQSPVCPRNDGISSRLDGITFSSLRRNSIKAAGNAIVPQLAYRIFSTIEEYTKMTFMQ